MGFTVGDAITGGSILYGLYSSNKSADISDDNAEAAKLEAQYQAEIAAINLVQHEEDIVRLVGQQRTAYAVSGVALNSGSVRDVIAQTKREADADAELIKRNAKIYETRYALEASAYSKQADITRQAGYFEAGESLLTSWGEE